MKSDISPLPGMLYSWPNSGQQRLISVVICVRPGVQVNINTGAASHDLSPTLAHDATYDLNSFSAEWSNLTFISLDDEAFLDPSV